MPLPERVRPEEPDVASLIARHFDLMRSQTPAESCHVLPGDALGARDVHLFAFRRDGRAVAIGALCVVGEEAELKSMHTALEHRGQGMGREMVRGLMCRARDLGVRHVALETGSGPEHLAARKLYLSEGFEECPPFGSYTADPLSVFMARTL